ncbi:GNAT family N-acetyltransferase [Streptomyces sp. NPDC047928]|uniref:GNAT family N-acetyltransferase n=1 Tax=unclassified Streptomyces TaxID=2593676 RepID=UPI00371E1DCD
MESRVVDRPDRSRYEILSGEAGGETAGFADYLLGPGEISFVHTETDPRFAGQGLGGRLARGALDGARARGLQVLPYCPFIRGWIGKHPEYVDLVPEARRAEFGL